MKKKSKTVWTYKPNDKGKFVKDKKIDLGVLYEKENEDKN